MKNKVIKKVEADLICNRKEIDLMILVLEYFDIEDSKEKETLTDKECNIIENLWEDLVKIQDKMESMENNNRIM